MIRRRNAGGDQVSPIRVISGTGHWSCVSGPVCCGWRMKLELGCVGDGEEGVGDQFWLVDDWVVVGV